MRTERKVHEWGRRAFTLRSRPKSFSAVANVFFCAKELAKVQSKEASLMCAKVKHRGCESLAKVFLFGEDGHSSRKKVDQAS